MKYDFAVVVQVSAEADFENGRSKMISCNVNLLSTSSTVEAGWKHKDGIVTEAGMKVQTVGLIQGLVAQLHFGHQMGLWDKDEHYRYILENLAKGFEAQGLQAIVGNLEDPTCKSP